MKKAIIAALTLLTLFSFTGCEEKDKISANNKDKIKKINFPNEKNQTIDLNIYFDSSKDDKSSIAIEERLIEKEALLGEIIMSELIKGPSRNGELKPILPVKTRLLGFSIKEGIAYVDLSEEAAANMTAIKEEACLKSIVHSLTQLPSISKVKILINHKDANLLGGNYDISKPFGKDDINGRKK